VRLRSVLTNSPPDADSMCVSPGEVSRPGSRRGRRVLRASYVVKNAAAGR
jgi:hypothetical protein